MTAADTEDPTMAGTDTTASTRRTLDRESLGLLLGMPLLALATGGAWAVWRSTADLDSIEERTLAWANIWSLTQEHVVLTLVCTVLVMLTAVPLGVALTRPGVRRAAPVVLGIANAAQAAPVIGILVLLAIWLGFGFWTAVGSLTVYAFLPVLRNTITGLEGVDPTLVEAARGMGMSRWGVLTRIELPMAVPVIATGLRTALVLLVGAAAFATFIDAGGLGTLIATGINLFRPSILVSGGLLVALLALVIDWAGRVLEYFARPKGM
ncbi:ABC transporter permease [Kytococcus sp. Marseille-QA3725]